MTSESALNQPPTTLEGPQCLHELIRWDEYDQTSEALDFLGTDGKRWIYSYGQLRTHITALARVVEDAIEAAEEECSLLKFLGTKESKRRQNVVPVLLPQSPSLYISILAILETGAAFCPINLDSPSDRIKFVVDDVKTQVIVTTRAYADMASWEDGPKVIIVEEYPRLSNPIHPSSSFQPKKKPTANDLAYIMYTSGSSGIPKGVALSHHAATQSLLAHDSHLPNFKRFLQFAAPSFDVSVFEIFFPLFRGATLVGCNRIKLLNDLTGIINELEIDAAELTPTVVGSLVQSRKNVPGLKLLLTIGEMLTRPVVDEFGSSGKETGILYGMYGPTEAAIHCTINPLVSAGDKVGNIGRPLTTVSTFICNPNDGDRSPKEPIIVPIGEVGELVLTGPQLAEGYLNRPEQNSAAFIKLNGKQAYRTGDKARQLVDGTIEILGRISAGQVKLRGQRVELGEIEEAVYRHDGIKAAVASVLNNMLVVFALSNFDIVSEADVLDTSSKWLPKFMLPGEIVLLDAFPTLPSGKVDRRQLEKDHTEKQLRADRTTSKHAGNTTERVVSQAVTDLLRVQVGRTTRLASLGLDSLVAIRLASVLRAKGFNVAPVDVLKADTLASLTLICTLATALSDTASASTTFDFNSLLLETSRRRCDFLDAEIDYILPCTPLQDAMLAETAIDPMAYKNRVELQIHGHIGAKRIQEAIQQLANRNAILRTSFLEEESRYSTYLQVVLKNLPPSQFISVENFVYDTGLLNHFSPLHPLHIQIRILGGSSTILIHIHHALYDAWSLELMLDDMESILTCMEPITRPPFRHVVEHHLSTANIDVSSSSRDYWQDHLAQLDPGSIPNFHSVLNTSRGLANFHLETSVSTSELNSSSRLLSVSSQSIFQAAYAVILSSYLNSQDVCFGTVYSGRISSVPEIENIVGPCLSTLPVRTDLSATTNLGELAQLMNSVNRNHLEHASLPLRQIKKLAGIESGRILFDSLLVWQQTLLGVGQVREHVVLLESTDYLEFNLTLEIIPTNENVHLKANYQTAIFPRQQIEILLRQIEQLVMRLINNSMLPCGTAALDSHESLLSIGNATPIWTSEDSLSMPVETIALKDPTRIAIEFAHSLNREKTKIESVTYNDLNCRANQLGNHLVQRGVLPNELVCICMEKSVELYISILATIKAGAGYLPLTPDFPFERLLYIVDVAKVKAIISHSSLAAKFQSAAAVNHIFVDCLDISTLPVSNLLTKAVSSDLAYCTFTSGSTGTPKGVLITRGNLASNLQILSGLYPYIPASKLLQSCSQAFDVSVFEIFFAWHIGGTLCSAVNDVLYRDLELVTDKLSITHLSLTPTVAALINPLNVPSVKLLVTAGEAVTEKVFRSWAGRNLWQGYGPSETTNICTIRPNITLRNQINNIGPPLSNTSVFILAPGRGEDFAPVLRGAVGEFCFGGQQVGRGYVDKSQTEERFFDHPKYGRLYRSGDFGRLLPDGSLLFTGRMDDQVKIRGRRIELGEINAVILRQEAVKDCVTIAIGDKQSSDMRIVNFWTQQLDTSSECNALKPNSTMTKIIFSSLVAAVPVYMVPSAVIPVSRLPSTAQGKIDKRHLVNLFLSLDKDYLHQVSQTQTSSKPEDHTWSKVEQEVAKLVAKTARVRLNEIGPSMSFITLGIDSLSAISLSRMLREKLGLQVEISDVLRYPSVVRLVEHIAAKNGSKYTDSIPKVTTSIDQNLDSSFFATKIEEFLQHGCKISHFSQCTPLQETMLYAGETSSNASAYRSHIILSLKIPVQDFARAWKIMVGRHEILRTCFIRTGDVKSPFKQVVLEHYESPIFLESSVMSVSEMKREFDERAARADEWKPPYSITAIKTTGTKMLISMHHALYDGFAMSVLFDEIEKLMIGEELRPPVSFAPFLQYMEALDIEAAEVYWKKLLYGYVPGLFTLSKKGESVQVAGLVERAHLKEAEFTRIIRLTSSLPLSYIEDRVRCAKTSLLSVCQAAWAVLLSKYLVQADICFGNTVSGRATPVEGIDSLVAPCFNTVPVRLQNVHKMSHMEAFRTLQKQNLSCLPFQLTPLRRIQAAHGAGRLFDTLVILQPPPKTLTQSIWVLEDDSGAMDLPVVIEVIPRPEKNILELLLHIHTSVLQKFDPAEILDDYDSILQRALLYPRYPVMSAFDRASVEKDAIDSMEAARRSDAENSPDAVEMMNAEEEDICNVIVRFTNIPKELIKKTTSIHKLGLDSINAVQIASLLRERGTLVLASDVLENPSIEKLAAYISNGARNMEYYEQDSAHNFDFPAFDRKFRSGIREKYKLGENDIEAIRPCTAVQLGMLAETLNSMENRKGDVDYVNSFCMKLDGDANISLLLQAWTNATAKIEMLRTGFAALDPYNDDEVFLVKVPFVMVTYKQNLHKLPLVEKDRNTCSSVLDSLSTSPWNLQILRETTTAVVKFTGHHAIYDAHSLDLILSEVASFYFSSKSFGILRSIEPLLSALLLAPDRKAEESEIFWKDKDNMVTAIRFPDLTPLREPRSRSFISETVSSFSIANLDALCRRQNVSIQAAGQAAWARLLCAYTGESSVTFGVTLNGRSVHETAEYIAFPTIVTLPISCSISGTNTELLARTMHKNARLHRYQFTPLILIQNWAGSGSGTKMFDSLFTYQKIASSTHSLIRPWTIVQEHASTDYTVSMELQPQSSGSIIIRLTAHENTMPREQAQLLLKQYDTLLRDTLRNGDALCASPPQNDLALVSVSTPEQKVLSSPVRLLHEFVEMQAGVNAYKVAFEFTTNLDPGSVNTKSWTYKDLNLEGNRIANLILHHVDTYNGLGLVAICFDKCPEASFAILGIMKAGLAYVALDPQAPPDRMKFIMEDSKASLILTSGKPSDMLRAYFTDVNGILIINLDQEGGFEGVSKKSPLLQRSIQPEDTCYCLYTSGTTGIPKGCEITHCNAVQAMMSFQHIFKDHWTIDSKWLQFASFHFDVSVLEQFWSWSVGICVASAPRDLIFEDIPGTIRQLGITHIDLTPSLARLIHPNEVPGLIKGVFITGGEQLKQEILDIWGETGCIYNGYGPTETTIGVTMYPRVSSAGKPSNIGTQFLNVGSYVLQPETEQPVLRGAVGELCVSGALVGKGYLNRPELTQTRFPVLQKFKEKVYRTGDLVRLLHNGDFLFLGRADDQVKLRGQRLELTEINEVIKNNVINLHEVTTLVLKHILQQKEQLVTFFVSSSIEISTQAMTEAMREACIAKLPGYMVPTHFIQLEKLPLSANNKADTKQLAKTFDDMTIEDLQKLGAASHPMTVWTEREKKVLQILAKQMGIESHKFTKGENIFNLGIDSISVISLSRRLQNEGYANAKITAIMKNPSITSICKLLVSACDSTTETSSIISAQRLEAFAHRCIFTIATELKVSSSTIEALAPCTPAQEGMIYEFLGSRNSLYFNRFDYRLDENVDVEKLTAAWMTVAAKVQVLRTKFVLARDGIAQVVLRYDRAAPKCRFTIISSENPQLELGHDTKLIAGMDKSVALQNPWRVSIVKTQSGVRFMGLTIFHALYDGISLPLLLRNVAAEYCDLENIDYGPQFLDALPHGPLVTVNLAEAEKFFRAIFKSWKMHALPLARNKGSPAAVNISVSRLVPRMRHLGLLRQNLGVTDQAILQAVWAYALQSLIHTTNITFGVVVSGRSIDLPNAEKVIGPMLNTTPFSINLRDKITWGNLIKKCHEQNVTMLPWQSVSLRDVKNWVSGGKPLFETIFVFQRKEQGGESELWWKVNGEAAPDYPLAFEAEFDSRGDLNLNIVSKEDIICEYEASELLNKVEAALQLLQASESLVPALHIDSSQCQPGNLIASPLLSPRESQDFEWTTNSNIIRYEIEELTGSENVSEKSSIFELGLDSIDVIKLSARLREKDIHLPVSAIIKSQTISKMTTMIISRDKKEYTGTVALGKETYGKKLMEYLMTTAKLSSDLEMALPATALQEGMVAEMLASGYHRYFNHELYRVINKIDMERLKQSWNVIIATNDILRTQFVEIDQLEWPVSFAQVVHGHLQNIWREVQLEKHKSIGGAVAEMVNEAINLAKSEGKLLQLVDIRHGDDQYFMISIAHALYDGWSLQALHQDVWKQYHGTLVRRPNPRTTVELVLDSDTPEAAQFWQTALTGLSCSYFPKRQTKVSDRVHRVEQNLSIPLANLQAFCRSAGISLQTLGQTTWALLLSKHCRRLDVVFGAILSCRDSEESIEVMYPLMNTVAVRVVLHGSLLELLKYMQENGNAMKEYQHFPLRKAQALVGFQGRLFDTLFIYQGKKNNSVEKNKILYEAVDSVSDVEFAVCVEMEVADDFVLLKTACKDSVLTEMNATELVKNFDAIVRRIVSYPDSATIASTSEGISVAGLPGFQIQSKILATRLEQPLQIQGNDEHSPVWTGTEMTIRKVLSQVSRIPENDITHDQTIFHLGLDSISAIKVSSILRRDGILINSQEMVESKSIRRLAERVDNRSVNVSKSGLETDTALLRVFGGINRERVLRSAGCDSDSVKDILPITAGQLYMLCRWQLSGGSQFCGTFRFKLTSNFDRRNLEDSWALLIERYPILRTIFAMTGETQHPYVQIVLKNLKNPVKWTSQIRSQTLSSPVTLSVDIQAEVPIVCFRIHHALYDSVSLPLLLEDLGSLYNNTARVSMPPTGKDEFRDFIARSVDIDEQSLEKRRKFWAEYLSPRIRTPSFRNKIERMSRIEMFCPGIAVGNLKSVAQQQGISMDAVLLASFGQMYSRLRLAQSTRQADSDIVFGLYLANRAPYGENLLNLVAPTVNLLPIRVDVSQDILTSAKSVQSDLLDISAPGIVSTSLREIYDWTGVTVACFVNIVKEVVNIVPPGGLLSLGPAEGADLRRRRAEVVDVEQGEELEWALGDSIARAYLPTVDIELRVMDDGAALDIGVFAPVDMLDLEEAKRLAEEMGEILRGSYD